MFNKIATALSRNEITEVEAHCDGPCGVYDPASARIAGEAVLSMTKKMLALEMPAAGDAKAMAAYLNSMSRYALIKEEQAHVCKSELLVLWTDYFKPKHLDAYPELHTVFWNATKECSYAKQEVSLHHAENVMAACKQVHEMFWASKGRDVAFYTS
ncbi:MAG: superoxide dismutase, Ni [Rhodobacterales bacterium]|nr:superoxide dismutase, Ni [Rhodobacterales bacterium]